MVARLGRDRLPGLVRDVGRVADDDVDGAGQVVERRRPGRPAGGRRRCRPGCGRPRRGPARRARRRARRAAGTSSATALAIAPEPVPRSTTTARPVLVLRSRRRLDRPAGEQLGLGPRHEHPRTDLQVDVAEVGDAGQVLQRLAGRAARDQRVVLLDEGCRYVVHERQLRPLDPQHVGQQHLGVVRPETRPRPRPGAGQRSSASSRRAGTQCSVASTASSRACRSASRQESMTGCRAPSSTWSRW